METETVKPDYEIARDEMRALLDSLGVEIECEFVPLSKSRNSGEKYPTVNWWVRAFYARPGEARASYPLLKCDYSQGVAHLARYPKGHDKSVHAVEQITRACELGPAARGFNAPFAVAPSREDVLSSLALDSEALEHSCFEDWAESFGYDPDSRKAEAIYRACMNHALALRNAIGDANLQTMRDLARRF